MLYFQNSLKTAMKIGEEIKSYCEAPLSGIENNQMHKHTLPTSICWLIVGMQQDVHYHNVNEMQVPGDWDAFCGKLLWQQRYWLVGCIFS